MANSEPSAPLPTERVAEIATYEMLDDRPMPDEVRALAREVLELREWQRRAAMELSGQQLWQRSAIEQMKALLGLIERIKPQSDADRWAQLAKRNHDLVLAAFRPPFTPPPEAP
jgi:hypothetical protein